VPHVGQQAAQFLLHHRVALAGVLLQSGALEHRDVPAAVADESGLLQFAGGLRDAFAAHAKHAGDQFLRHDQVIRGHAVERQQQPAAQLLLHGMMPVAGRGLEHLRDQRLAHIGDRPRFPARLSRGLPRSTWSAALCPPTKRCFDLGLKPRTAQGVFAVGCLSDLIDERRIEVRLEQGPIALPAHGI